MVNVGWQPCKYQQAGMFWNGLCLHSRCLTKEHGTPLTRLWEWAKNVCMCVFLSFDLHELLLLVMICGVSSFSSPGVHHQPSEEVSPGDVVHCILFGWDGSCSNLSIQMVWQHTEEARDRTHISQEGHLQIPIHNLVSKVFQIMGLIIIIQ